MKKGQIVITSLGARGIVTWLSKQQVEIRWTLTDGGNIVTSDDIVKYPMPDIQHSVKSGFLEFADSDDPNIAFLVRKSHE